MPVIPTQPRETRAIQQAVRCPSRTAEVVIPLRTSGRLEMTDALSCQSRLLGEDLRLVAQRVTLG